MVIVLTQVGEFKFYRNQLWTAPELLRMTTRPVNGTQKADVYSFAIVLQEIMFRAEPYFIGIAPARGTRCSGNPVTACTMIFHLNICCLLYKVYKLIYFTYL